MEVCVECTDGGVCRIINDRRVFQYWRTIICFSLAFQVMFEKYQCAGVYVAIQAVLTLYAQGKLQPCGII